MIVTNALGSRYLLRLVVTSMIVKARFLRSGSVLHFCSGTKAEDLQLLIVRTRQKTCFKVLKKYINTKAEDVRAAHTDICSVLQYCKITEKYDLTLTLQE